MGAAAQVIWIWFGLADARKRGSGGRLARFAGVLQVSPAWRVPAGVLQLRSNRPIATASLSGELGADTIMDNRKPDNKVDQVDADPSATAVAFVTTEHFTLQGARSSTISESTGRASMFLTTVSGGLVALGLLATATKVGAAFYAFGLIILPTLAFVGLVTFERVLQSGIEDHRYARRIAWLRGYYFDQAPELVGYLLSVAPAERLRVQGLGGGLWQGFLTVAGMVGVITAVLAGSAAGLLAGIVAGHSLVAALAVGAVVAIAALAALMRYQHLAWKQVISTPVFPGEEVVSK